MTKNLPPNRLKELREAAGLSMLQLAALVRPPTTDSQINKLEKSRVNLTHDWMMKLADALQVNPIDLICAPERPPSPKKEALHNLVEGLSETDAEMAFKVINAMAEPAAGHRGKSKEGSR